jgi:hypothetical protein
MLRCDDMSSDIIIITQDISEAVQSLTRRQIARAYAVLERCPDPPPMAIPGYETTWISNSCVLLTIEAEGRDFKDLTDFLTANGFESVGSENGLVLYSSRVDSDDDAQRMWEAAWAFLRR